MQSAEMFDFAELVQAFQEGLIIRYPIGKLGEGFLEIDGVRRSVVISWPRGSSQEAQGFAGFKNLEIRNAGQDKQGVPHVELRLDANHHPESTLAFAAAVVSQLTAETPFVESLRNSVDATRVLLRELELLSEGKATGLIGELLFFASVARLYGVEAAIKSWMGPPRGEHDFSLADAEFEVKTTRSERRVHRISTGTQLWPVLDRELFLVSIQLTETGLSESSFSLPGLVEDIRELVGKGDNSFEQHLHAAGWRDWFSEILTQHYQLRSAPLAFRVDSSFPAITPRVLREYVENGELLEKVSYNVDVSSLTGFQGLPVVDGLVLS